MNDREKLIKSSPKDFFLYLLSILTLYLITTNIISLLFSYINRKYPMPREFFFMDYAIRWNIAALIVALPVYIYTLIRLKKDAEKDPRKNNLRIRKWLLGLTLFVAIIILMSDIGVLLFYFLGGEITIRFILKTFAVLIVIGYLVYFYLHEIKSGWTLSQLKLRLIIISLICVLIIIKGLLIVGSPFKAQKEALDNKRISDLKDIQYQILRYWKNKQKLPDTLEQLTNTMEGYKAPVDPETGKAYFYRPFSKFSFQFCTTFNLASEKSTYTNPVLFNQQNWTWDHPSGFTCFVRTIDPDLYNKK